MKNIKITDSQNLLLQGLLSMAGAAILSFSTASVEYISQHGVVSIPTALSVGLAAFLYSFGLALKAYVPAHIAQELQALKDAQAQAQTLLASLQSQNNSLASPVVQTPVGPSQTISSPMQPIQGPLVVVNHPGAMPSNVEVAYNNALATQQAPLQGGNPLLNRPANPALDIVYNKTSVPQPQASPVVDDFPSNPVVPAVSLPAHLAALTNMSTQQNVPQVPFPDDTLTGVQAARLKAAQLV